MDSANETHVIHWRLVCVIAVHSPEAYGHALILARCPDPDPRCNVMPVTAAAAPPGPKPSLLSMLIYFPGRDPLAFFSNLARTYGDLVAYRMGGEEVFFVNDPQHIKDILVTHNRNFIKGRGLQRAKRLLGEGLLTSEGAAHLRQRRPMPPAIYPPRHTR